MQLISYYLILPAILVSFAQTAQAQTASLKDRLKAVQTAPYAQHEKVMIESSRAILALPRTMDGTWDQNQIEFVLSLLEIETDEVYRQQMIEDSAVYVKDNRKRLVTGLKFLPPEKAKTLLFDIDAVISVHERGNNQPTETPLTHTPFKGS